MDGMSRKHSKQALGVKDQDSRARDALSACVSDLRSVPADTIQATRYFRFAREREQIKAQHGPVRVLMKDGKPVTP